MWDTVMSLIEKKWTESRQPRKRLCKAMLLLYSSLENCHINYTDFKSQRNCESLENWAFSVRLLMESFESVEKTLQIFDVELYAILKLYSWGEFFSICSFKDEGDTPSSIKRIEEDLKSYLASIELAAAITSNIKEEDKALPDINNWEPLLGIGVDSSVYLHTSKERLENELKHMRDQAVFTYDILLRRSGVNAGRIIDKFDKDLSNIDELDFALTLNKLRDWLRKEFTIDEVFANIQS